MKITVETGNEEIDKVIVCVSKYSKNLEFIEAMKVLGFHKKHSLESRLSEISEKLENIDSSISVIP